MPTDHRIRIVFTFTVLTLMSGLLCSHAAVALLRAFVGIVAFWMSGSSSIASRTPRAKIAVLPDASPGCVPPDSSSAILSRSTRFFSFSSNTLSESST